MRMLTRDQKEVMSGTKDINESKVGTKIERSIIIIIKLSDLEVKNDMDI